MADINATMESIREEFSIFTNLHDKYVLLVDMANDTAGLAPDCLLYTSDAADE